MNDKILTELIQQAPVACVLLVMVWLFLKFMKSRDESTNETIKNISDNFVKAQAKSDAIHERCVNVIERSNETIGKACEVIQNAVESIKEQTRFEMMRRK